MTSYMYQPTIPEFVGVYLMTVSHRYLRRARWSFLARWDGQHWRDAKYGMRLNLTDYNVTYSDYDGPASGQEEANDRHQAAG